MSGYNHPSMLKIWKDEDNVRTLVNRPALGYYPNVEWAKMLRKVLLSVAPPGLNQAKIKLLTNFFPNYF
jgi:4-aminobutyrate aminotransferase/(S)-3-amino-2-methylpropionate transaminase